MIEINYDKKKPTFKKLTSYLEEVVWKNEDYIRNLSDKDGYLAGEATGCRNTAKEILDYIKTGKFNLDLEATDALLNGRYLNDDGAHGRKLQ